MFSDTLRLEKVMSHPDKAAIIFDDAQGNEESLTYAELKKTIDKVGENLRSAGIEKGDRVVFLSENHLKWIPIFLGIADYGAIVVPVDGNIAIERFNAIVEDCKPAAIIISRTFEGRFAEFMLKEREVGKMLDLNFDLIILEEKEKIEPEQYEIKPEDIAALIYTSGTTGSPKGIMLSHRALRSSVTLGKKLSNYKFEDIMIALLPFTHVFSLVDSALVQLGLYSTIVLSNTLNPADILKLIMKHSATFIIAVPRLAELFAAGLQHSGIRLPPIKMVIGGASCRPEIIKLLVASGVKPMLGYGMTETSAGIVMSHGDGPIESCGRAVEEISLKIDNPKEKVGELLIKSPTLFTGVYGKPELAKELFDEDGYFKSGDLGEIDEKGNVFIRGRAKEVIISSSGLNVYPDELEMRFGILPYAEEFAVFGLNEEDIEFPAFIITPKIEFFKEKSVKNIEEYIEEDIRSRVAEWPDAEKIKKIFVAKSALPRSANGKVQRFKLQDFVGQLNHSEDIVGSSVVMDEKAEKLFKIFRDEVAAFLNIPSDRITRKTRFDEFIQLDSLGVIAMLIKLENKFKLSFRDIMDETAESFDDLFQFLMKNKSFAEFVEDDSVAETKSSLPSLLDFSARAMAKRQELARSLSNDPELRFPLPSSPDNFSGNIEGFMGFTQIPVGLAGPINVKGEVAQGDFYIPLATTEGALVSSVARGCQIITLSGGADVRIVCDSVVRTPIFIFESLEEMSNFSTWIEDNFDEIKKASETTTRHGKLESIEQFPIGSKMILRFSYSTGDASGQNMTTIATRTAVDYILNNYKGNISEWFLESNLSGDKKINGLNFTRNRGKKIIAQIKIPKRIIEKHLHTTPERMRRLAELSMVTSLQAHAFGVQAHFANILAAVYIAAGQDPACVAESAAGITHLEIVDGDLQISITLPGIMIGTVGGGTRLPTQKNALKIMQCAGVGNSRKFAEILAATVLAGEISLIGAMAADEFTTAHAKYGRSGGMKKG
jgi:hydroxymethylglutaryl-CoA reductase (NADPH)